MSRLNDLARRMPAMPEKLMIGLSGGADSVALLRLVLLRGHEVEAVHVNHGLRGEASDGDEAFVRDLCRTWHVPLTVHRLHPPEHPSEDWARQARYRCFRETMTQSGAEALVLAHHRDDQAETLLMHLLRGAGMTGLTAMSADIALDGMRVLRPLLAFTRAELQGALAAAEQPWREDESNGDSRYLRNAIRNDLLPLMERLSPGCGARIAATAAMLQEDESALDSLSTAFLNVHGRPDCLPLAPLKAQPEGLRRRILRRWWQDAQGFRMEERSLNRQQTETLAALIDGRAGEQCNLPGGWHGYRGWTHLHLTGGAAAAAPVLLRGELPQGCTLRTRQPGDWLQLPGGRKSLQDYFTDRKVDAPFRDRIPLICRDSQVLVAAGVPIPGGETFAWQGDMPWNYNHTQPHDRNKGD